MNNLTVERTSEIIKRMTNKVDKSDLFEFLAEQLNPFDIQTEKGLDWKIMFAEMCGYVVCKNVDLS